MRVLAIDPGERVGWAHGTIVPGATKDGDVIRTDVPLLEVTGHGISFLKDFALKLHEVAGEYDVIVYETWRLRASVAKKFAGNDMQSSQLIGMVRMCAWLNPSVQLVSQGPSIKATAERTLRADIRQTLDGLPKAHDEAHDGDALLHLWHWFWTKYV